MIDYSVIIRTTGKAHEKYQGLLQSIAKLEPQPKEIIVVLPEGYDIPKEKLGWETYYFSPKGMVIQRMTGIALCKTKYALVCDDDVQFDSNFVKKLYRPIEMGYSKLSVGPLYSFLPRMGLNAVVCTIMANATPTIFHRNRYVSVLRSSGYSYNKYLNNKKSVYYETQSAAWTCFFGELDAIREIDFEDEKWLDMHGYSAMDDQTMFYKAWLRKIKTVTVSDAMYLHLDAKTSTQNNKAAVVFSCTFNRVVFWHRFIFMQQKNLLTRVWSLICFLYYVIWSLMFDLFDLFRRRLTIKEIQNKWSGYLKGWKYLISDDYKNLPSV